MPLTIDVRAGDTEPLELEATAVAGEELTDADLTSAVLYMRKTGSSTNHVDGQALGGTSVSSSDNGDGTWDVTLSGSFDPAGAKNGGGDAFDEPAEYEGYILATWSDGDETRHPAKKLLRVNCKENFE